MNLFLTLIKIKVYFLSVEKMKAVKNNLKDLKLRIAALRNEQIIIKEIILINPLP